MTKEKNLQNHLKLNMYRFSTRRYVYAKLYTYVSKTHMHSQVQKSGISKMKRTLNTTS